MKDVSDIRNQTVSHIEHFQRVTQKAILVMFDCVTEVKEADDEGKAPLYVTDMPFAVRIQFTGVSGDTLISGEYLLATDERVAAAVCGVTRPSASSAEVVAHREDYSGAFSEMLNSVVGEAVLDLEDLGRLRFSTPRVSYGKMSYGALKIRSGALLTDFGRIECHFHCDRQNLE